MAAKEITHDKLATLSRLWLFEGMDRDEIARLARHARIEAFGPNRIIFRKGDPGVGLMAVLSGRVRISTASPNEREVVLNIIDQGGIFGEIALLDGEDRTADATAMEAVQLLVLDRRDFLPTLERNPEVGMRLIKLLCSRLRQTSAQLEDTVFLVQAARLAKTLLRLAENYGKEVENGIAIDLALSQKEIGTLVGMRREPMNRQLAKWREQGLIDLQGRRIVIADLERFRDVADDLIWQVPD